MITHTNDYENAEVVAIGTARSVILGEKNFPMIDNLLTWPLIYRTDPFELYDDDQSTD
jgi:hypothetical protein